MIAGLQRAAHWARRWAATSEHAAGARAERILDRLGALVSRDDLRALEAHYGALALQAFARAVQAEADREVTDVDIELDDPTPVRR